jgi:hypothetical protein
MTDQFQAHIQEVTELISMFDIGFISAHELAQMTAKAELFVCRQSGGQEWDELSRLVAKARRLSAGQ